MRLRPFSYLVSLFLAAQSIFSCQAAGTALDELRSHTFGDSYNPVILIKASNELIHAGGDTAYARLKLIATKREQNMEGSEYEIVMLCRMIYQPKMGESLRLPFFGGLTDIPEDSMPRESWPDLPLVLEGGIPFLMSSHGYTLGGLAESMLRYVDYCNENGRFRTSSYRIPSRVQAKVALASLLASPRWKALRWKDGTSGYVHGESGTQYELSETVIVEGLRAQVANIK